MSCTLDQTLPAGATPSKLALSITRTTPSMAKCGTILAHGERQEQTAWEVIAALEREGAFPSPIVTQVVPFETFYRAEEYHQEYYEKNPFAGYCMAVIRPKVAKFRKAYKERLKEGS